MRLAEKLIRAYFNIAYNQVYDFTTARLSLYRKLQDRCIGKLELRDNDKVLCVGLGTGNEISHILRTNKNVNITGIDYSGTALRKAYKKGLRFGREIELLLMDARHLRFGAGSFDKVLCLHLMDFLDDHREVTHEIFRVLKDGGQFVITYPSDKEGPRLGCTLIRDGIRSNLDSGKHRVRAVSESLAQMLVSTVYMPLLLRSKPKLLSHHELEAMITTFTTGDFTIEEDAGYQDFVVYGRKQTSEGGN